MRRIRCETNAGAAHAEGGAAGRSCAASHSTTPAVAAVHLRVDADPVAANSRDPGSRASNAVRLRGTARQHANGLLQLLDADRTRGAWLRWASAAAREGGAVARGAWRTGVTTSTTIVRVGDKALGDHLVWIRHQRRACCAATHPLSASWQCARAVLIGAVAGSVYAMNGHPVASAGARCARSRPPRSVAMAHVRVDAAIAAVPDARAPVGECARLVPLDRLHPRGRAVVAARDLRTWMRTCDPTAAADGKRQRSRRRGQPPRADQRADGQSPHPTDGLHTHHARACRQSRRELSLAATTA